MAIANQDIPTLFPTVGAFQDTGFALLSISHVISQALHVPLAVTCVIYLPGKGAQDLRGTHGRTRVRTETTCDHGHSLPISVGSYEREENCMLRSLQAIKQNDATIMLPGDKAVQPVLWVLLPFHRYPSPQFCCPSKFPLGFKKGVAADFGPLNRSICQNHGETDRTPATLPLPLAYLMPGK